MQIVSGAASSRSLVDMVESAGTESFSTKLLNHLNDFCAADYCAVFRVGHAAPAQILSHSFDGSHAARSRVRHYLERSYWSKDPAMAYAQSHLTGTVLMHMDVESLGEPQMREAIWPRIRDRLVLAGRSNSHTYTLSILRDAQNGFSTQEIQRLGASAELLISILDQHTKLLNKSGASMASNLKSLASIESTIQAFASQVLTQRERQVCARILWSLTTTGIALDLGVSAETVKTFRKLAYRKLAIGSQRELLDWYMSLESMSRSVDSSLSHRLGQAPAEVKSMAAKNA